MKKRECQQFFRIDSYFCFTKKKKCAGNFLRYVILFSINATLCEIGVGTGELISNLEPVMFTSSDP